MTTRFSAHLVAHCTAAALLLSLGTAGAAQPADPAPVKTPTFRQFGTNGDGYIDAREASASLEVSGWITSADTNKDGKLTEAEFLEIQRSLGIIRQ